MRWFGQGINVGVRDASEPPRWGGSGDVIEFADEVWVPADRDAAVAWMKELDRPSDGAAKSDVSWRASLLLAPQRPHAPDSVPTLTCAGIGVSL